MPTKTSQKQIVVDPQVSSHFPKTPLRGPRLVLSGPMKLVQPSTEFSPETPFEK